MTTRQITGARAVVELTTDPMSWTCLNCGGTAGTNDLRVRPEARGPFVDKEINGLFDTAEGHAVRSATAHAERVCVGREAADLWRRNKPRLPAVQHGDSDT